MKKKMIFIFVIIIAVIVIIGVYISVGYIDNNKNHLELQKQERYKEIKENIDKELNRYLYVIAPKCQKENAGFLITHKDLVYNAGMDKEKLLDVDNKSYCKVYVKADCIEDGKWNWTTTISCKNYTDKGYIDWAEPLPSKN